MILWDRLVTCGRLVIGPLIFLKRLKRPITNRPQDTILPHMELQEVADFVEFEAWAARKQLRRIAVSKIA